MALPDGKAIITRHLRDGVGGHDPTVWDEIMAPDFVMHVGPAEGLVPSRDAYKAVLGVYWAAFPDLSIHIHRLLAEGDVVAAHYVERGTHNGPLGEHPPSGRAYAKNGLGIYRIEAGRMAEAWIQEDDHGFARQLALTDFGY